MLFPFFFCVCVYLCARVGVCVAAMEIFHSDGREDVMHSQGSAVSFTLPCVFSNSGVTEQSGGPRTTRKTDANNAQQEEASTSTSQQYQPSSTDEYLRRRPYHSGEGASITTESATRPSADRPSFSDTLLRASGSLQFAPAAIASAAAEDDTSPLPANVSSATPPHLPSSACSEAAPSPAAKIEPVAWSHAIVVFDKLFCVCFVPHSLRPLHIGELVQCEFGTSDNTATIVADVSSLVATVMAEREPAAEAIFGFDSPQPPASGVTYRNSSPLYRERSLSGIAADHQLCRLPSLLRRGTNRDKKRVYFARVRSNDALALAQHELLHHPITAQAAEYQVNFNSATIYLAGDRSKCVLAPQQLVDLGNALLEKLRCETVAFRFWGDCNHSELDLTRALVGRQHSEMLYEKVVEHLRSHAGRPTQRAVVQASIIRQATAVALAPPPPPPPPPPLQPQRSTPLVGGPSNATGHGSIFPSSRGWSHASPASAMSAVPTMTVLQQTSAPPQQQHPVCYTLTPSIYVSQQQPQPQPQSQPQPQPRQQSYAMQALSQSQSLSFVQPSVSSSYQAMPHIGGASVAYITPQIPSSYYDNAPPPLVQPQPRPQPQHQPQQSALAMSPSPVSASPVYYVVPSSAAMPWDRSSVAPLATEQQAQFNPPQLSPQQQQQQFPHQAFQQQSQRQHPHYLQHVPSSSQPSVPAHAAPALFQGPDGAVVPQSLQSRTAYTHTSPMAAQGYRAISQPVVFSPKGMHYQQF